MRNLITTSIIFSALWTLPTQAFVNLSNGEFTAQAVDLQLKEGLHSFKLYRFYNHKVEVQGMFGHRWCSNIEQELRETDEGYVSYACGQPTPMLFKENSKVPVKKGDKAYSWGKETLIKLANKKNGFIRFSPTSGVLTYNSEGLLIGMRDSSVKAPWVRFLYGKNKLIQKITYGPKTSVSLKYDEHKQLLGITGAKRLTVRYKYSKKNNTLIFAQNVWKHIYRYDYDGEKRITKITYPNKNFDLITYDPKSNTVAKTTDRNSCSSSYYRRVDPKSPKLHVQVVSDCASKPKNYVFHKSTLFPQNRKTIVGLSLFKKAHDPKRAPASLPLKTSDKKVQELGDTNFQYKFGVNETGQPTAVIETDKKSNKKTSLLLAYENGQLKTLSSPAFGTIQYIYNKDSVLVRTVAKPLRPKSELSMLDTYERFLTHFNKRKAASW